MKRAGALVSQHPSLRKMTPSFNVPTGMSLPDAVPIPNIPYSLPSLNAPRWVPIVTPLSDPEMMQEPKVAPPQETIEEKPKPKPKPLPKPELELEPPPLPTPKPEEPITPIAPEIVVEQPIIIEIPFIGEIPVPSKELLVTAGSTAAVAASVSVVAALSATTLINYLMKAFKPLLKFVMKRILKRKNKYTTSWARQRRLERLQHQHKRHT